jgi:hypothetical protein
LWAAGQNAADTSNFSKKWNAPHSPFKATLLSAALPSAGQIYNRKYWKAPIVVAGIGTCTYFILSNTKSYQHYKSEYIKAADNDPLTVSQYTAARDGYLSKVDGFELFQFDWCLRPTNCRCPR